MDQSYESLRALVATGRVTSTVYLLALLLVAAAGPVQAQVCDGNITLSSQAEVDAFACTEVRGSLFISGTDVADLSPLSGLTSVGGSLSIRDNPVLASLEGLDGLTSADDLSITITGNAALTALRGLEGISFLRRLTISNNSSLASLTGLETLTTVSDMNGGLYITNNPALRSLEGLGGLTTVGVEVVISGNASLISLAGLEALSEIYHTYGGDCYCVDGNLLITNNASLASLAGLTGLSSVKGILQITDNPSLTSLTGLDNLSYVGWALSISNNTALTSLRGLESLGSAGHGWRDDYGVFITDNPALTSLTGLENFRYAGHISISNNDALPSLRGLDNLSEVSYGGFVIRGNDALTSLEGLQALQGGYSPIYALSVLENSALTSLAGLEGLSYVVNLTISGNASLASLRGLEGLRGVEENLLIADNPTLASLAGLEGLSSVTNLHIRDNPKLTSLAGLDQLSSVGYFPDYGDLIITGNPMLASLAGLEGISSVGGRLVISNNAGLASCSCGLAGLISEGAFTGVGGEVVIDNNALESSGGRCNSPEQVLATPCDAGPGDSTPPVCGLVSVIHSSDRDIAIEVSPSDPESGIQQVAFRMLANATAVLDGAIGPFTQGQEHVFTVPYPSTFTMRADKTDPAARSSVVIEVTNGAGLTSTCDPVLQTLTAEVPESFALEQNYPNPFNPSTEITFALPEAADVRLVVYDATGREVARLVEEVLPAGTHRVRWSAAGLPSGIYFYRLSAGRFLQMRAMTLLK